MSTEVFMELDHVPAGLLEQVDARILNAVDVGVLIQNREGRPVFANEAAVRLAGCAFSLEADRPVWGEWDRSAVEQVVTNFLSNATKYAAGGPVTARVSANGEWATVEVADSGIGIAEDALERIFGRFERAVESRHYGGLGLGLFISRQVVEAMGGRIEASSRPGTGSTFRMVLPRKMPTVH